MLGVPKLVVGGTFLSILTISSVPTVGRSSAVMLICAVRLL